MRDPLEELESAADRIDPRWDPAQKGHVLDRVHARVAAQERRRRGLFVVAVAAAVSVAVVVGIQVGRRTAIVESVATVAPKTSSAASIAPADHVLRFADGSSATSTAAGTELQIEEVTTERMTVSLERGAARFEVHPNAERAFKVRVDSVTVTVIGTMFEVQRREHGVRVAVERGKVRIDAPSTIAFLEAGQAGEYPFGSMGPAIASAAPSASSAPHGKPAGAWRELARKGLHKEAYTLMGDLHPHQVKDAEELLAAADVARLSGHPQQAIPFLERVLADFKGDARAPLAAFALGRILLPTRPAEAALRFALARTMAPSGALAQDALAREVEAWARAGNQKKAKEAAEEYVRRHPNGARVEEVRKLGGL